MSDTVTIVQLYPEELGVAGDRGNVMALRERLSRAGMTVSVVEHRVGDSLPTEVDLVLVGNGPLSAIRNIYDDLRSTAPALKQLEGDGVPIFAYGSGAELLGHDITLLDGTVLDGFGLFPFRTTRVIERKVGYVIVDTPHGQVVGFEDNASLWQLDAGAAAFGTLVAGGGNGDGAHEGVVLDSSIATQVGGPVLPLNPLLSDSLIASIATRRGLDYAVGTEHFSLDRFAEQARAVMVANAKHVFSRI
ncbi:glutamine amidotransferase [Glaciihabitans sp. UYNi722]|uniref:type 1 glutamine amidotransferase n=1 Tax=Glaciihabitans sp. UYNi722 TaxID=3156344 RepID=UPI003395D7CD